MHGKRGVWRAYAKPYPTAVAPKQSEGADKSIDLTGGNSDGRKKRTKCNLSFKTFAAFTLAEILLSLTVIGIVAAIALPSLLGNANERAWETQKKALYTRFSQALPLLPSLNGYGEYNQSESIDTAAETFVRDGLSKVMKITNICDSEHLGDCGLPNKIIPMNNSLPAIDLAEIKTAREFNDYHVDLNTKAAAFETVNGESILVYYNPNCEPDLKEYGTDFSIENKLCANFVYDLNGKKGPNTVGKDIGFILATYATDPVVVSVMPYPYLVSNEATYNNASALCKEKDPNLKVPNIDELMSIFYNIQLVNVELARNIYKSSTTFSSDYVLAIDMTTGVQYPSDKIGSPQGLICVKR